MQSDPTWIYLSPHLDDAVYSCGGLIYEQTRAGIKTQIWTVFAGDPPPGVLTPFARSLHERWQSGDASAAVRRREDIQAGRILGAVVYHFTFPDCIYRREDDGWPVITGEEDLFRPGYQGEETLRRQLTELLAQKLPPDAVLVFPYGYGQHIDHQLVGRAAAGLDVPRWQYADYPYTIRESENLRDWLEMPGERYHLPVTRDGLRRWQDATAAYQTQISTFWKSRADLDVKIEDYWLSGAGALLRAG